MKLCILLLLAFPLSSFGQHKTEGHWGRRYSDIAYAAAATDDGGYIIAGLSKNDTGDHVGDIVVIKTTAAGDTSWTFVYGGPMLEGGNSVMQTADGEYLISGHTEDFGARDSDAFLMKLNRKGEYQWLKVYGGDEDDISEDAVELKDGSIVFGGITASYGNASTSGLRHVYLVKTNRQGEVIWSRFYAGRGTECIYSMAAMPQGGFLAAGYTSSFGNGELDGWLLRINDNGDTLWTRRYQAIGDTRYRKMLPTIDGGYLLCGFTNMSHTAKPQGLVVKLDANGNTEWEKTYGDTTQGVMLGSVTQLPSGNFIFTGCNYTGDATGNMYILTTDAGGNVVTEEITGGHQSLGTAIVAQGNNGYMVAGTSAKSDPWGDIFYVVRNNTVTGISMEELPAPNVFPNPFTDKCVIILPASHANELVSLSLFAASGRLIFARDRVPAKDIVISRDKLSSGLYFCTISCPDGKRYKAQVSIE